MQEIRRFKPSTVSRRLSVAAGFYKTCLIDGVLEHSPAEHVRRPSVPPESPTLGFTHLQFAALLTAARDSSSRCDFALVAMLGLLGLPIFSAKSTATGCCVCVVRAPRSSCYHCHLPSAGPSTRPSAAAPEDRSCSTAAAPGWTATPRPAGYGIWPKLPACGSPGRTLTCSATPTSRSCSTRAWTCEMSRSLPGMRIRGPRCATTGLVRTSTAIRTTPGRLHGLRHLIATVSPGPSPGRRPTECRIECVAGVHCLCAAQYVRAGIASTVHVLWGRFRFRSQDR